MARLSPSASHLALHGLLLAAGLGLLTSSAAAGKKYSHFVTGDAAAPVQVGAPSAPSFVLMGGGPDVDEAFRWMVTRAGIRPGTGGRFVVIRATGTEAYDPYIFYSDASNRTTGPAIDGWVGGAALGLSSVETLVVPSVDAANDPGVSEVLAKANAVFIAGGDQSDYIKFWKGTALDRTLQQLMARNVPVGGTSAGLAVLGQFDFAALKGSVTSEQTLANPYNRYVTLDPSPLALTGGFIAPPALAGTITDSHLDTRDRMGRLIGFMSRLVQASSSNAGSFGCAGGVLPAAQVRGIGIGVETAVLVEGRGNTAPYSYTARRVTNVSTTSESAAYFLRPLQAPTGCASGQPLTVTSVEIRKLADDAVFDLSNWTGLPAYHVDAISGALTSNPY